MNGLFISVNEILSLNQLMILMEELLNNTKIII